MSGVYEGIEGAGAGGGEVQRAGAGEALSEGVFLVDGLGRLGCRAEFCDAVLLAPKLRV